MVEVKADALEQSFEAIEEKESGVAALKAELDLLTERIDHLLDAEGRERARHADVPVHDLEDVEDALAMAGEDRLHVVEQRAQALVGRLVGLLRPQRPLHAVDRLEPFADQALADLAGVKSVSANLPQNRLIVGYVAVDEIVSTVLNYAGQFGAGINVQLPPELPPAWLPVRRDRR